MGSNISSLAPPPYDSDIIEPAGFTINENGVTPGSFRMSSAFAIWLQQLFTVSGSFISNDVLAAFTSPSAENGIAPDVQIALSFGAQISSALQRISDLEEAIAFRPAPLSQVNQIIICTQATFPLLNAANANSFIYVSDYFHFIFWNGTTPVFADGGSNYYAVADANPAVGGIVAGGGWIPADGSMGITYLKADGTLGTRNLPNTVGTAAYLKVGTGASLLNAPVAPLLTMASYTPAGAISTPALAMASYTPAGSISGGTFAGTPATITSGTFTPVALASVALTSLGGSTTSYTPAGAISGESFAGTPATLTGTISTPTLMGTPAILTGTIGTTGEPENMYSRLWYRT